MQSGTPENQGENPFWEFSLDQFQIQPGTPENQGENPFWESSLNQFQMQPGTPENQGENPFWESSPELFQSQQYSDHRPPLTPRQFQYPPLIYTPRRRRSALWQWYRTRTQKMKIYTPSRWPSVLWQWYRTRTQKMKIDTPRRRRSALWQWYRTRTRNMKISIGCGAIMAVLLFFSCVIAVSASITGSLMPKPTATSVPAVVIASPTVPQQTPISMPTQGHASTPTRTPTQTQQTRQNPTACPGVKCNPWGYNFTSGNHITTPPSNFCSYFACISDFWSGHGYVVECQDGKYTKLGGLRNPCMHHDGDPHPLYSH